MRGLWKNKSPIWYAHYSDATERIVDGMHTGEPVVEYTTPEQVMVNISYAGSASALNTQGFVEPQQFGLNWNYDRYIVVSDPSIDIDETSVVWVDKDPQIVDGKATVPHDYIVKRVGRSINSTRIVVRRVDVA